MDLVIRNHTGITSSFSLAFDQLSIPPETEHLMGDYTQTLTSATAIILNETNLPKTRVHSTMDFSLTSKRNSMATTLFDGSQTTSSKSKSKTKPLHQVDNETIIPLF
jgi:hypothetical protein